MEDSLSPPPSRSRPSGSSAVARVPLSILVVEDNEVLQSLIRDMVQSLGHQATAVGSAEAALQLLSTHTFALLLADIDLPGMSGIELAQQAHQQLPDLRIAFASAYGYLVTDRLDFDFALLHKPFTPVQLKHVIDDISAELAAARPASAAFS